MLFVRKINVQRSRQSHHERQDTWETRLGVFRLAAHDDLRQGWREGRVHEIRRRRQRIDMLHHDRDRPIPSEGKRSRVEFIEDHAQRVDIAALIGRSTPDLFRGEIERDILAMTL